jgi:hypothetical protein
MPRDLVVIGGSAGSLAPLRTLVDGLPPSFPACVLVVVHSACRSREAGYETHLTKPVDIDRLLDAIEHAGRVPRSGGGENHADGP